MNAKTEKFLFILVIALCVVEAILYAIEAYLNYQQCPTCY
jgi:hypothetical protein